MSDPELDRLLAIEIERRLPLLVAPDTPSTEIRAALHSLKGSAGMAGHAELALVLGQIGARVRAGEGTCVAAARSLLRQATARLRDGLPPFETRWPEPPPGFSATPIDPRYRADYLAAMQDRLAELDAALSSSASLADVLGQAYRSVHSMKGAAGSVGDHVTAWYCHGLESRLRLADSERAHREDSLWELARHRSILRLLIEEPGYGIELLRGQAARSSSTRPAAIARRSSHPPAPQPPRPLGSDDEELEGAPMMRIATTTVDRFLERLDRIHLSSDELEGAAVAAQKLADRLRDTRLSLLEALRMIGPATPWGAPSAALQKLEQAARGVESHLQSLERGGALLRKNGELLRSRAAAMRADLGHLRRTHVGWLFERVTHAVERLAAEEGKLVQIETSGADLAIDRRLAERLLDPVLQLARNAVAHGIQTPAARAAGGKSSVGMISLRAERLGEWLRLVIEDDGSGVDVERVRALAIQRGVVSAEAAPAASHEELLSLLFLPGVTTRAGADLLAGRGVGLDLAEEAARRVGGAVRLQQPAAGGVRAIVEVPSEQSLMDILWVRAAGQHFALPVGFTGRIEPAPRDKPPVHLAECLGLTISEPPELALALAIHGVQPIALGIDAVGQIEEVVLRPIPELIATCGPYCGAILRSDGSLRLVLDAALLAAHAWSRAG
ncbi:MAG TPA: Hpt domain-containing protein [Polyangiaceae bacterium]|nr:Hpt domain-containing protein [Polyangiaceae bacterium]